jgi:hypothetical protein
VSITTSGYSVSTTLSELDRALTPLAYALFVSNVIQASRNGLRAASSFALEVSPPEGVDAGKLAQAGAAPAARAEAASKYDSDIVQRSASAMRRSFPMGGALP